MKDNGTIASRTVDILVATYNGEKYIRAQLLSLLFQTHANIRVLVHDDGSTDKTCEIIREIARVDSRVVLIEDGVRCGGAGKNFMHLLKFSRAGAVMFCDQDDIWFDNKVSEMLSVLKEKDNREPQVVYSEIVVWHPTLGIDGFVIAHPKGMRDFLFLNGGVHGCAAMFNAKMRSLMLRWHGFVQMHDHVLALVALTLGHVTYMNVPLMLYRRHVESVTGKFSVRFSWKSAFVTNRTVPVVTEETYEAVQVFSKIYGNEINRGARKTIEAYLRMKDENLIQRILTIVSNRFELNGSTFELIGKVLLRPYMKKVTSAGGHISLTESSG